MNLANGIILISVCFLLLNISGIAKREHQEAVDLKCKVEVAKQDNNPTASIENYQSCVRRFE